ncbi:MAG: primosomal protein N' [Calditrichae bacterium]|nr:primosomal protein N' [Calditrichia bacterium]
MQFAEVVFNLPLNHSFTYGIPPVYSFLTPGYRVLVPFGKRVITGVVTAIKEKSEFKSVKDIIDVLDEKALIKPQMLELTKWISEYYLSSWGQAVQLALPKGLDEFESERIHIVEEKADADLSEKQRELYFLIADNPGQSKTYYRKKFGTSSFYSVLNILKNKNLVYAEVEKKSASVGTLLRDFVIVPKDYNSIKSKSPDFLKYTNKRPEIDAFLQLHSGSNILVSDFLKHTKMARATLQKMHQYNIIKIEQLAVDRKPEVSFSEKKQDFILVPEQLAVLEKLKDAVDKNSYKSFLLHGITGSGKTVVYIEILKKIISLGKSAVILIPEIALTPQTVSRFEAAFNEEIAVFHSKMSAGQRYDAWMACYKGQVKIVIGPRSALFAPLENLGLIVVDEEHEQSYKQTESAPLYHARDVALYWAKMHEAVVVLGSATPSFESYYNAQNQRHELLEIKNRATKALLPEVHLVDMRKSRGRDTQNHVFSPLLLDKMKFTLSAGEQVILMQNRRGFASFQQCMNCGFIPKCTECEVSLTYHTFDNKLRCHYCGLTISASVQCANCGSDDIDNKGIGTQRIQDELASHFPDANVLRMDQDTTRGKNAHDQLLSAFREHKADILLGTQMIAKGLDFENVTLVGVISADVGLGIPDFRSGERIFQLLSQVAGRSGRGSKPGQVVIQTYQIEHYAIQFAKDHDYRGFYSNEIKHREVYNYPPFNRMIQITVSSANISDAISRARDIAIPIRKNGVYICDVIGPAPATISKLKNLYRWQISLKINRKYDPSGIKTKELLQNVLKPYTSAKNNNIFLNVDVDPAFGT